MKNLYTKKEFLTEKNRILTDSQLNEGFFGNLLGKFWNYLKGIKGGQEVKNIYDKYVKIINDEFKSKGKNIQLNLGDAKPAENNTTKPAENQQQKQGTPPQQNQQQNQQKQAQPQQGQQNQGQQKQGNQPQQNTKQNNSYSFEGYESLNEAEVQAEQQEQKPAKFNKAEHDILMKIVNLHKNQAQKEMNAILQKYGGAEKSPKLAATIGTFMYQFDVALTRAELAQFPNDNQLKTTLNQQEKEYNQKVTAISKGTTQDAAIIDIGGKKMKLNTPYQYNAGGQSKTIMITGKSKDNDKVIAKYVSDKLGKTIEQPFRANLIKTDFVPEVNKKYSYFSTKENNIIEVEVLSQPDKRGLVKVKTKNGNNIFVQPGALMAKKEQKPVEQPAADKEKQGEAGNQSAQPKQVAAEEKPQAQAPTAQTQTPKQ